MWYMAMVLRFAKENLLFLLNGCGINYCDSLSQKPRDLRRGIFLAFSYVLPSIYNPD